MNKRISILIITLLLVNVVLRAQIVPNWTDVVKLTYDVSGATLTKPVTEDERWDAGARSENSLKTGKDGEVKYVVEYEHIVLAFGLSVQNLPYSLGSIDYTMELSEGRISVYDQGTLLEAYAEYSVGDVLRVERKEGFINFIHNENTFARVETNSLATLHAMVEVYTPEATVGGFSVSFLKPIEVTYTLTEETPTTLGSIELATSGGAESFYYLWSDGDLNEDRYNLESGNYTVTVFDTLADSVVVNIKLPTQLQFEPLASGLSFVNNKLTKTGGNGWTNGMATLKNQLTDNSLQGEIIVGINELGKDWIYGLREDSESSTSASVYQDLDYGFYINSDDELYTYDADGGLQNFGSVIVGDDLSIETDGENLRYKKNDVILRQTSLIGDFYKIDFSLKTDGEYGPIDDVEMPYEQFRSSIIHSNCALNNGEIAVIYQGNICFPTFPNVSIYPLYSWVGPNGFTASTSSISGIPPGVYTITVEYCPNKFASRTYTVGYKVKWTDKVNTEVESIISPPNGLSNTLVNNQGSIYGTNGGASCNVLSSSTPGWAEFTANADEMNDYLVFGLSANNVNDDPVTIDYGIELVPYITVGNAPFFQLVPILSYRVMVSGSVTPYFGYYKTGDKFKIERTANGDIEFYKNSAALPFYSLQANSTSSLIVDVSMNTANTAVVDANVSFYCRETYKYAVLRKKLDVSYYEAENGRLRFKYLEKYRSGDLDYKIYNNSNQVVADGVNNPIQKVYGDNWLTIDVFSIIGSITNDYYILEVLDEEGRKELLRFHLIESILCD